MLLRIAFGLIASLLSICTASAELTKVSPPIAQNWEAYAQEYLWVYRENRPFDPEIDTNGLRCVKMNNYGCLWQRSSAWRGTPGPSGRDGAHDGAGGNNGHAIFVHPKWSIVAAMDWFQARSQSPVSALSLAERYAPWCDTIGSGATKSDGTGVEWGRGCVGGRQPPAGFSGPRCGKPQSGQPTARQCQACNCPNNIARFWLRGTEFGAQQNIVLFEGRSPTDLMRTLIINKIALETGRYQPTPTLVDEAFAEFADVQ